MKARIVAVVFGILISATAFAQRGGGSPEDRAERVTAQLTEKLNLSEDQATEVKEIYLSHMKEGRGNAEKTSSREERMAAMKAQQAAIEKKFKTVFSEEQFQQYLIVKEEMKEGQGKRRGKRGSER